jgi:hypothetical protein
VILVVAGGFWDGDEGLGCGVVSIEFVLFWAGLSAFARCRAFWARRISRARRLAFRDMGVSFRGSGIRFDGACFGFEASASFRIERRWFF